MATIQNTTVRVTHSSYYWNTFSVFTYWYCYNLLSISCVLCCLLATAIRRLANFESLTTVSSIWRYYKFLVGRYVAWNGGSNEIERVEAESISIVFNQRRRTPRWRLHIENIIPDVTSMSHTTKDYTVQMGWNNAAAVFRRYFFF